MTLIHEALVCYPYICHFPGSLRQVTHLRLSTASKLTRGVPWETKARLTNLGFAGFSAVFPVLFWVRRGLNSLAFEVVFLGVYVNTKPDQGKEEQG